MNHFTISAMNRLDRHHFAEYVAPGHPDRLADAIAETIIHHYASNSRRLVGVEVATHDVKVFVDGRVTVPLPFDLQRETEAIRAIVRKAYGYAGYGEIWGPAPDDLEIIVAACIEAMQEGEEEIRSYSDDQNVAIGYAEPSPATNDLPPAHWLANRIGRAVLGFRNERPEDFGPDFKVLPVLRISETSRSARTAEWERLTLSLQHRRGLDYELQYNLLFPFLSDLMNQLEQEADLKGLGSSFSIEKLHLNGAGDFRRGGPEGDNGLSGKKLVVDHYGPDVPIGGGALCGKDAHKVDRVGPLRARQLAKRLCRNHDQPITVRLSWSPGDEVPFHVEATRRESDGRLIEVPANHLPPRDWFAIDTIYADLKLGKINWPEIALNGYFQDPDLPWEL